MAYSLWFVMRAYLIYIAIPLLVSGVVLIGSGYASFGIYGVIMGALFAVGWVALIIQQITKATGAGSIFDAVSPVAYIRLPRRWPACSFMLDSCYVPWQRLFAG